MGSSSSRRARQRAVGSLFVLSAVLVLGGLLFPEARVEDGERPARSSEGPRVAVEEGPWTTVPLFWADPEPEGSSAEPHVRLAAGERPPEGTGENEDLVSRGSLLLVVELRRGGVTLLETVTKGIPFRRFVLGGPGRYRYALEDAGGRVLHQGRFDVRDLCPLAGTEHQAPHLLGHVVVDHQASALVRVPDLEGAKTIAFSRALPDLDIHPLFLGRAQLRDEERPL